MADMYYENIYTNGKADPAEYMPSIVADLADLYEENLIDNEYISPEVMSELADLFESVPVELRAVVFRMFKEELDTRGVPYTLKSLGAN